MANYSRVKRIDEQLKQELSLLIRKEIHDPRALMISVTDVDMVKDFSHAKVYVTYLGPEEERDEIIALLEEYGGEFRRQLGRVLRLHTIPQFFFLYDDLLEQSNKMSALISQAIQSDEAKAEQYNTDYEPEKE